MQDAWNPCRVPSFSTWLPGAALLWLKPFGLEGAGILWNPDADFAKRRMGEDLPRRPSGHSRHLAIGGNFVQCTRAMIKKKIRTAKKMERMTTEVI